jgi:uncharacterized membrane protein YjgN (DUF898 family)
MHANRAQQPLLQYDGKVGEIYAVFLKNLLLTIITFGIYRFWAVSGMRRYVWSHMKFQGERFEYTGTGGELFKGYLIALGVIIGGFVVAMILSGVLTKVTGNPLIGALPIIAAELFVAVVALGAYFSAQRYRLSRTLWCGIRGGMSGSALRYGVTALGYGLLGILSLGQLFPWITVRLAERRINASSFGSERFHFEGRAGKLYLAFLATFAGIVVLLAVLGAIFFSSFMALYGHGLQGQPPSANAVLAILLFYVLFIVGALLIQCAYLALVSRHIIGNTTLGSQLQFSSGVTAVGLLGLMAGNLAWIFLTFGLGTPFALHRSLRFTAAVLFVQGSVDPAVLLQNAEKMPRTGEGALNVLDHGGSVI